MATLSTKQAVHAALQTASILSYEAYSTHRQSHRVECNEPTWKLLMLPPRALGSRVRRRFKLPWPSYSCRTAQTYVATSLPDLTRPIEKLQGGRLGNAFSGKILSNLTHREKRHIPQIRNEQRQLPGILQTQYEMRTTAEKRGQDSPAVMKTTTLAAFRADYSRGVT